MTLASETRWSRLYRSADGRFERFESRFSDGTATVTLAELQADWPHWNEDERLDFCHSFVCTVDVSDREEILRFLVQDSEPAVRMTIALSVAKYLPPQEAVQVLKEWCQTGEPGRCANYFQALALTKDPGALDFLRDCFQRVWKCEGIMESSTFQNWIALDAMWCIRHLLELGEDVCALRSAYETLKNHACAGTRDQTRRWLSQHFEASS
jgi:hypothetical protein